ncbi:MAG: TylF/MycF/NovP-related O-methyltransferase, partial [Kordiimonas sp.]
FEERKRFDTLDFNNVLILMAFDDDEAACDAVKQIDERGGRYISLNVQKPAFYHHINWAWREIAHKEQWRQTEEGFSKWNVPDFDNLIQALEATKSVEGDYLEVGCFRGSSGSAVLAYLNEMGWRKRCWFLDVFEGFNYEEAFESSDMRWSGSHETEGKEVVEARLRRFETPDLNVIVEKKNIITDDLDPALKSLAVVNIDVDMYEAVAATLVKCAPLVASGGIMIAEDAGHTPALIGARLAVQEFIESEHSAGFTHFYVGSGQHMFFKR